MTTPQQPTGPEEPTPDATPQPGFPQENPFAYQPGQPEGQSHPNPLADPLSYPQGFDQAPVAMPNQTPGSMPGQTPPQTPPYMPPPMPPQQKKGGCMKWGLIIAGILVLLTVFGIGIGIVSIVVAGGPSTLTQYANPNSGASQSAEQVAGNQEVDGLTIGDTYQASKGLQITVNSFSVIDTEYLGPHACALVTYQNSGSKEVDFRGYGDWTIQNSAGVITNPTYSGENDLQHGKLAPGGTVSGNVCFDDSAPGDYIVQYKPEVPFRSEDRATWKATI